MSISPMDFPSHGIIISIKNRSKTMSSKLLTIFLLTYGALFGLFYLINLPKGI